MLYETTPKIYAPETRCLVSKLYCRRYVGQKVGQRFKPQKEHTYPLSDVSAQSESHLPRGLRDMLRERDS